MRKWLLRMGLALWLMCSLVTLYLSFENRKLSGPSGSQGLQGSQGVQGVRGDAGLQGVQGEKGDTGATGLWGLRGPQGLRGEIGYSVDLPKLYKQASPAVVWIGAETAEWIMDYDPDRQLIKWQGTGFLVSDNGLIATAGHVVMDTKSFEVMFSDGTRVKADFIHMENIDRCDVGFIKLNDDWWCSDCSEWHEEAKDTLIVERPYLEFDTDIEAGESAIILGYPWGSNESISITSGIVAAPGHKAYYTKLSLYADVASYPGNSGSPVLNMDGEVIGILVAGPYENECYSMCTPARLVELAMQKALAEVELRDAK